MANNDNNNQKDTDKKGGLGAWGTIIVSIVSLVMVVIILAWATNGWANWNPEEWFNSWGAAQTQPDDTQGGNDTDKDTNTTHTHTFDTTKWLSDGKNHWHGSTCGHNITRDTAAHTFVNNVCKVCGYVQQVEPEPHVHTYDMTKWVSDSKNHWHGSTCGHDIISDAAAHTYNFTGTKCTVCGYEQQIEPEPHVHTYDTDKWVNDEVNHWHGSTCGHDIVKDMAAHTYKNGVCTVCGYIDTTVTSHTHTFDEAVYDYDRNNHWHPSSCGHNVTSEPVKHTFINNVCECGYNRRNPII